MISQGRRVAVDCMHVLHRLQYKCVHADLVAVEQDRLQDGIDLVRPAKHTQEHDKPTLGLIIELGNRMSGSVRIAGPARRL